jgi:hypothetical protein
MRTFARPIALTSMIAAGAAVASPLAWAAALSVSEPAAPTDHRHQTGLALMPGAGYRVIVPYQDHKVCGDTSRDASKRVCTNGLPLFLDLQLSFGLTRRLDLLLDMRFGLIRDPIVADRQFALAPGVRFWFGDGTAVKLYTTVQGVYDSTDYHDVLPSADFGLRNANGLMYDAARNVGLYAQFGETVGLRRWLRMELDGGLGVQVRLP